MEKASQKAIVVRMLVLGSCMRLTMLLVLVRAGQYHDVYRISRYVTNIVAKNCNTILSAFQ